MHCPKCGHDNPAEAKFCGKCATRLSQADTPISPGPVSPGPTGGDVSQGLNIGIIIGTLFMPLLGIIMGLVYMNDASQAKKAVGKVWLYVGIGVMALYCVCVMISGSLDNL